MLHMDTLLPMPITEILLLQPRVAFNLMRCGHDATLLQQRLELFLGEVRYADRPSFARGSELLHRFPCVDVADVAGFGFAVGVFGEFVVAWIGG